MGSTGFNVSSGGKQKLWSNYADAQSDLNHGCKFVLYPGFRLATFPRLIKQTHAVLLSWRHSSLLINLYSGNIFVLKMSSAFYACGIYIECTLL